MTRFYYDCPRIVSVMEKYHGMKFCNNQGDEVRATNGYFKVRPAKFPYNFYKCNKQIAFIHPESLPLLEPQVGDYVQVLGGRDNFHIYQISKLETLPYACADSLDSDVVPKMEECDFDYLDSNHELPKEKQVRGFKIIQRNSTPFFWPKEEEDT